MKLIKRIKPLINKDTIEFFRANIQANNHFHKRSDCLHFTNYKDIKLETLDEDFGFVFLDIKKILNQEKYNMRYRGRNNLINVLPFFIMMKYYENNYKIFNLEQLMVKEGYKNITEMFYFLKSKLNLEKLIQKYSLVRLVEKYAKEEVFQ
jgi:hypothetical protein